MKLIKISSIFLAVLIITACKTTKKTTTTTANTTTSTETKSVETGPALPAKSKNGIYPPGNEELTAIQLKYKEVTMETLTQGHTIYVGACTKCHGAKSIYSRTEAKWQHIIDEMAPMAKLSDVEKDAVYKYVLAIKATQPK